jgi:uncharacterized protein (TIGR03792 family)
MKINFKIKEKIKILSFLFISLFFFLFQINSPILKALPMDTYQTGLVTEELRLKIPSELKKIWLQAEKEVWEPWLSIQDGFLGRQIFWDKEKEEALILVNWENKKLWKSISMNEVNEVQEKFEKNVKTSLNTNVNPFELIYEGELVKQG